jgi:hypothetical protein
MKQTLTCLLLLVLVPNCSLVGRGQTNQSPTPSTQTGLTPKAENIKAQVAKLGVGKDVTVKLLNTKEYHGSIRIIDDRWFAIYEVELKQVISINYDEVRKVSRGYSLTTSSGRRVLDNHRRLIATIIGIVIVVAQSDQVDGWLVAPDRVTTMLLKLAV